LARDGESGGDPERCRAPRDSRVCHFEKRARGIPGVDASRRSPQWLHEFREHVAEFFENAHAELGVPSIRRSDYEGPVTIEVPADW
jgi:hypothetical protein